MDTPRFRAFISYSRSDRRWAKVLQARLEHYVLPQALRLIKPGRPHERRPLKPVFRDEDELVPGQDLPERIRQGLTQSEYLIVVCSPRSAASEWVGKELRDFIALGRRDSILAVVVDGEPNAERHGHAPELECLPRELRFQSRLQKDETGNTTATISSEPTEPLWVDWRKSNHRNRPAFLRLVAALLSLSSLDELIRKDRAYQRRRAALLWSVIGFAACCILGLGIRLLVQARETAMKESEALAALAQKASESEDWESSARYALLALKRANLPVIGFQARTAEDALQGALLSDRRAGPEYSIEKPRAVLPDGTEMQDFEKNLDNMIAKAGIDTDTALSHAGTVLAVADRDGTVWVLDAVSGKPLRTPLQVGITDFMGISSDGKFLATHGKATNEDQTNGPRYLEIWDIARGTKIQTLGIDSDAVYAMEFSPDDKYLASVAGWDTEVETTLLEVATGHATRLAGSLDFETIAFSPSGMLLACAGEDGVMAWNTATKKPVTTLIRYSAAHQVQAIALASDDRTLALGTKDGSLIFWNLLTHQAISQLKMPNSSIASVGFSRDGRQFGAQFNIQGNDSVVGVWPVNPASQKFVIGHADTVILNGGKFAFLPDNKRMLTVGSGVVRLWSLNKFDRREVSLGENAGIGAFSPDGRVLAVSDGSQYLVPLDTETLAPIGPRLTLPRDETFGNSAYGLKASLTFSPDGKFVAFMNPMGTIIILADWHSGQQWQMPIEQRAAAQAIAFSPDGKLLAVALGKRPPLQNLKKDLEDIQRFAEEPLSKKIDKNGKVAETFPGDIQFWDVASHKTNGEDIKVENPLRFLAFSQDGAYLAFAPIGSPVQVWDLKRDVLVSSSISESHWGAFYPGHRELLTWVASGHSGYSPPGEEFQSWDAVKGQPIGPKLELNTDSIQQAFFVQDAGRALLVGDSKMAFWDLSGAVTIGASFEEMQMDKAYLSTDGRRLMALGTNGDFYSWNNGNIFQLRGRALIDEVCRTVLPGDLSKLTKEELSATPVLDPRRDADACAH